MAFSAGRALVTTTVNLSGTIPAPGNSPVNTLPSPSSNPVVTTKQELTYGLGSGLIDMPLEGEFLLAAGASLTVNLYDGGTTTSDLTFLNAGSALRLCKSLTVSVVAGGDSSGVSVGNAASNAFSGFFGSATDLAKVYPDGPALTLGSPDGATVDATHKNVKLLNNSSTEAVVVRVTAAGCTIIPGMWMGFGLWTYP